MQAQRIFVAGHFNVADLILGLRPFPRLAFKFATQPVGVTSNVPGLISISPVPSDTLNTDDPQARQKCRSSVESFQFAVSP